MYSKFDYVKQQHDGLRQKQNALRLIGAALFSLLALIIVSPGSNFAKFLCLTIALLSGYLLSHLLLSQLSEDYRTRSTHINSLSAQMNLLREKMAEELGKIRQRQKGQQFKKAYNLSGQTVESFEKLLGLAMWHEKKEVYVTAFCRKGHVVRVTASIGSAYSCRPADNVTKWKYHAQILGCDEIRQYHNHPTYNNSTAPSPQDVRSSRMLRSYLGEKGSLLTSYIIFWNEINEFRVLIYSDDAQYSVQRFYDVSMGRLQLTHGA